MVELVSRAQSIYLMIRMKNLRTEKVQKSLSVFIDRLNHITIIIVDIVEQTTVHVKLHSFNTPT